MACNSSNGRASLVADLADSQCLARARGGRDRLSDKLFSFAQSLDLIRYECLEYAFHDTTAEICCDVVMIKFKDIQ